MANYSDSDIQKTIDDAEKEAESLSFPESTIAATHEDVLNPVEEVEEPSPIEEEDDDSMMSADDIAALVAQSTTEEKPTTVE
ncbi:hypothetical protein MJH12_15780, partial [bacterium]|nr:hypothetical protein [bacterium]